ncbi:MAG: DNA cytosine methyltransferase [Prevotella sp.]|uniref:DNA cytosine methyltransferase n=1 Tax=Prevotella sp. TaxID=59823 RepID=UPI00258FF825|nr:DNA cytosine methyltransferase [Prevotella sp.]MDD6853979.1 DNA cytosine methyltransferase [Prevotella sp.]
MRVVDLFCGCGGLSLGFIEAGFNLVAAFDNWDDAITVYHNNFKHPVFKQDLSDVEDSAKKVSEYHPDMIIGGPPCQDFSSAGKRDENNGRGDLTVDYAHIIEKVRPEWFVMENVDRILKTTKLKEAISIYKSCGYGLTKIVLNASRCGVPQRRKRFIMIGHLGEQDDFMLKVLEERQSDKEMTIRDYMGNELDIDFYYRHPRSYARRGIFSVDEPSPTIRGVNRPMPAGYTLHHNDPVTTLEGIRPLTALERSMIQTFPKNFKFLGTKTNLEQMIGNAVPVNLGKFVADSINSYLGVVKTVDYTEVKQEFPNYIVNNSAIKMKPLDNLDKDRNVLVSLVKNDNVDRFLDGSANIYYTGKKFPSTVALNKLYYFMPYVKHKGIKDLYFIRMARVGTKKEVHPECDDNDFRLVFEIEYVGQLFDDYKPIHLDIWQSFTDTTIKDLPSKLM